MKADDIRSRFLAYFEERGHARVASGPLVPPDDPTLLFTNAGMVPFKKVFLGLEEVSYDRAVTSQKCVRAGGKHNDLEQVGKTARHHTFFEMLGNFSFGDYFKRDAIAFAWEFITEELGMDPGRLYATVHHSDDEAARLWEEVAGLDPGRIHRLGDEENFWQMADTGPCGPCSELHYDFRPEEERDAEPPGTEEFERLGEEGRILELWNLVFMQYDRDQEGNLNPLPAPSIDTGAGLERLAAVLQGVHSNYHTDLFTPLLERVAEVVGRPYDADSDEGVSYRVLADHARAVAFLLAEGVMPTSEGRGYVVRRILRRAVRHAWLLGRREPTLAPVVDRLIERMRDTYPELAEGRDAILETTRREEESFLARIEGGLKRFDEVAPPREPSEEGEAPVVPGEEVFRLYDTHGFPVDLTQLMAEERGYQVDLEGFQRELERQRERSRQDRKSQDLSVGEIPAEGWRILAGDGNGGAQTFVGYERREVETEVLALWRDNGTVALQLKDNPFYVESGGQVSDRGEVHGVDWTVAVEDVIQSGERVAVVGTPTEGRVPEEPTAPLEVRARVDRDARHDTERNHTATHLLHAALRDVLGSHVVQRGSLVAPDRLRFDFSHGEPLGEEELEALEDWVNARIWKDVALETEVTSYDAAMAEGAMALFGERYGDRVRVVRIPDVSTELCGGTHVRHTGEVGSFRIVREGGVASGVRRIEAVTGPEAHRLGKEHEEVLRRLSQRLKTEPDNLESRLQQLLEERDDLEEMVQELRREGGSGQELVHEGTIPGEGDGATVYRAFRIKARSPDDARRFGDELRQEGGGTVAVVAAELPEGKRSLFAFVTDDLIERGVRADAVIREVAALAGGRGGGRAHMAQAGVSDPERLDDALVGGEGVVRDLLGEPVADA